MKRDGATGPMFKREFIVELRKLNGWVKFMRGLKGIIQ